VRSRYSLEASMNAPLRIRTAPLRPLPALVEGQHAFPNRTHWEPLKARPQHADTFVATHAMRFRENGGIGEATAYVDRATNTKYLEVYYPGERTPVWFRAR
jgi:hypothetical protein